MVEHNALAQRFTWILLLSNWQNTFGQKKYHTRNTQNIFTIGRH